ncbi:hypothetical protein WICPIJ_004432 [Wickerhamomyces pijperi]|uniref:poly(A)-specific ribonuclease n=1 Tax=Wickerhamomyces pijperi TaxID=599730 RepID=A0A9P8TMS4_WICPI|nr:hypothetical protein WICPIJ_004432 [Wickerhamomyces pijperi]
MSYMTAQQQHQQQHQQNDLSQAAHLQKLNQLQQQQTQQQQQAQPTNINGFNSPQIPQTRLNPQYNLLQQQQQQQQQQLQSQLLNQQHMQQQQQQQPPQTAYFSPQATAIKEVWSDNFQQEFNIIRQLISQYNYVSFTTEFPGILARPIGVFSSTSDYHYQTLRTNADLLNLIQFGISLSDANGKKPDSVQSTWQFNFKFDPQGKMISTDAIESLMKTGIDFNKHANFGIDQFEFAELLTSSGLVLLPNVYWTSFHAGYDFGFLISMLTNNLMPMKEEEFLLKLKTFFPKLFDLKILSKGVKDSSLKISLESLAEDLNIPKLPSFISSGGQALLTNMCLIEIKKRSLDMSKFLGLIHGLSNDNSDSLTQQLGLGGGVGHMSQFQGQGQGQVPAALPNLNGANMNQLQNAGMMPPPPPNLSNLANNNQFNHLLAHEMN